MNRATWHAVAIIGGVAVAASAALLASRDRTATGALDGTASDSRIVEWQVGPPTLRIGGEPGDSLYEFNSVAGALRLDDGNIVVVDGGTVLRLFDRNGRLRTIFGRSGEGPGEFSRISSLRALDGASFSVYDRRLMRLSTFSASLGYLHAAQLELPAQLEFVGAVGSAGVVVGPIARRWVERPNSTEYYEGEFLLVAPGARSIQSITTFEGPAYYVVKFPDGGRGQRDLPFSPVPRAVMWGERLAFTRATSFSIEVRRLDGSLERTISKAVESVPVGPDDLERYRAGVLRGLPRGAAAREQFEDAFYRMPKPRVFPVIDDLVVDSEDNLWVLRYAAHPAASRTWDVFRPEGVQVATVPTPFGVRITSIGSDYMVGVETDSLDREQVLLLPLIRAGR